MASNNIIIIIFRDRWKWEEDVQPSLSSCYICMYISLQFTVNDVVDPQHMPEPVFLLLLLLLLLLLQSFHGGYGGANESMVCCIVQKRA